MVYYEYIIYMTCALHVANYSLHHMKSLCMYIDFHVGSLIWCCYRSIPSALIYIYFYWSLSGIHYSYLVLQWDGKIFDFTISSYLIFMYNSSIILIITWLCMEIMCTTCIISSTSYAQEIDGKQWFNNYLRNNNKTKRKYVSHANELILTMFMLFTDLKKRYVLYNSTQLLYNHVFPFAFNVIHVFGLPKGKKKKNTYIMRFDSNHFTCTHWRTQGLELRWFNNGLNNRSPDLVSPYICRLPNNLT